MPTASEAVIDTKIPDSVRSFVLEMGRRAEWPAFLSYINRLAASELVDFRVHSQADHAELLLLKVKQQAGMRIVDDLRRLADRSTVPPG